MSNANTPDVSETLTAADARDLSFPAFHSFDDEHGPGIELIQSECGEVSTLTIPDSWIRRLGERLIACADKRGV